MMAWDLFQEVVLYVLGWRLKTLYEGLIKPNG